ncbi:MAG: metallopeptidase TldD-related protein [Erysipelotrichales bacterium]|nr:metallopeptidase TldD-related protein [Erysipelotrichales bacterium]
MIKRIEELLKANKDVNAYRITEKHNESVELFYVLKKLETNRATDYTEYSVTVYRDFNNFRGSATFSVAISATDQEIKKKIEEAVYAASFVENPFFELPKKESFSYDYRSNLTDKPLVSFINQVADAVFKADIHQDGWINSTEIFLHRIQSTIVNSNGIEASYENHKVMIEVIPTWKNDNEEVELYKAIEMSELNLDKITSDVKDILLLAKERSLAVAIPANLKCNIILQEEEVESIFQGFAQDLHYSSAYRKMSLSEVGKSVQTDEVVGDKIDVSLTPYLAGSTYSKPVDDDGVVLKEIKIIENGIAKNLYGNNQTGFYLGIKNPTGNIPNVIAKAGTKSFSEMQKEPHIYCVSFSGMQFDLYSGFFGGEVRLGFYFDGKKTVPVTGFSISGDIHEAKKNLVFSKEETVRNGYKGPKYLEIKDMQIL